MAMEALCPRVKALACNETVLSAAPPDRATIIAAMLSDADRRECASQGQGPVNDHDGE